MASFNDTVYPHRSALQTFCRQLVRGVEKNWTEVTLTGLSQNRPGAIQRCSVRTGSIRCNFRPAYRDKMRIRALLKAWTRSISDRYLDLQLVNQIANRRHASVDAAYDAIRANASTGGAVKFVRDELLAEQSNGIPTFFGSRMFDNYNWNTYYTMLLHWDDHHCYGLMQNLERQGNVSGGAGGRQGNMWLACRNWVENTLNNRTGSRRTVYHEYNIRFG